MTIDFEARRAKLDAELDAADIDVLFLPASQTDLEYFTGLGRGIPSFGNIGYTNHWISGAFFSAGKDPLFVLTRHHQEFHLPDGVIGDIVTATESDDGEEVFARAFDAFSSRASRIAVGGTPNADSCGHESNAQERIAVSGRTWSETTLNLRRYRPEAELLVADDILNRIRRIKDTHEIEFMRQAAQMVDQVMAAVSDHVVAGITELELASEIDLRIRQLGSPSSSFDTAVWAMGPGLDRDASERLSTRALSVGAGVNFDFGAIVEGYCSDFGRTVHIGQPNAEYEKVYEIVMAAQEAGRKAAVPGATGGDVHRATRSVIDESGYGDWFRHRTGHCIGKDVHELPYISEEDETPLEPGMMFTIEPSVFYPGRVGVRVEDVFLLSDSGETVKINELGNEMRVND
ncbi:Xaa-Pro aminopeptidase [Rhodoglobus vestalii]|uniref:Xaa-Pro aminopeptidase n=1 Tax=Rhodoglobus vestalii TaxID=193384 RepID=A0A8H2K704_9MICO|nr:M24 family metallopeptidase [Rhodoglobus vestalii]TQO19849.1 Xaa-Pro aminopeptidase [Rhodoglobus vestalii]